jgi:hypothetical protein
MTGPDAKTDGDTNICQIRILIRHPSIDPESITRELKLVPSRYWHVGTPRKTPAGHALKGAYSDTMWNYAAYFEIEHSASKIIEHFVDIIHNNDVFVKNITATGGTFTLAINLPGYRHIGGEISGEVLGILSSMGVNFGFEVFPEFQ